MSRFDTARRGISLVLAVLCLLVVPELASARFQGTATVTQSVGTVSLATPTAVKGSFSCTFFIREFATVTVTGFDKGSSPAGTKYVYSFSSPNSAVDSKTAAAGERVTLRANQSADFESTTWTLSITPVLGTWHGEPSTTVIECTPVYDSGNL